MNPVLEQLARYAVQELGRGVPEVTLTAALRESGWTQAWINAALSLAKQRAVPAERPALNMLPIQQEKPLPAAASPSQPLVRPVSPESPESPRKQRSLKGVRRALIVLVALLSVTAIALGAYRALGVIQQAAQQRVERDAERREDLSILLNDLSDYFVTHKSYPTREQMNSGSFLSRNGFIADARVDPKWSIDDKACTKDKQTALAGEPTPNCYGYEVMSAKKGDCDNDKTACSRLKIGIWLEVDKRPYTVVLDKNSQVN